MQAGCLNATATTSAANNPIMGIIRPQQEANGATTTKGKVTRSDAVTYKCND